MFDLFNRKRVRELEAALATERAAVNEYVKENTTLTKLHDTARNQVEYLVRTIRDIDQQIWQMSQKTDWVSMRPHFTHLAEGMTTRKRQESDRINDVLRGELIETYKPTGPKQIGSR